jgi:hypothetical protein
MSSGFFVADNKIPLKEDYVAIPSQNGLTYDAQKVIEFYIPPNVEYFKPQNSYLQFDLTIAQDPSASNTRLQLDELIGAQILLDTVRIHSGDKSELLEEIRHYPVHVAMKYAYHSNETLKNLRALNEGAGVWTPDSRGSRGSTKSQLANHKYSPYYSNVSADPTSEAFTNSNKYTQCKIKLPLHTGLFQNDKIVPNGLMNGLFVSILTSENKKCFRQLDSVNEHRRLTLNPLFHSLNGSTLGPSSWANGSETDTFYIKHDNNNWEVDNFPLVVGETFKFGSTDSNFTHDLGGVVSIKQIETSGTGANKYVKITLNASATNNGSDITNAGNMYLYSTAVSEATSYNPTYSMSNVELVLNQIDLGPNAQKEAMADMKAGKMMVYDFLSTQVYNYSQLKGDRVANIGIPGNHQRAKSVICVPTDASVYAPKNQISCSGTYEIHSNSQDHKLLSSQSGIAGMSNRLTEYFFFYDGRNQPSLNVNTEKISSKSSVDAIALLELDKALDAAGMPALQMSRFNENFAVGRTFSLNNGVYDMRNKDLRLNVHYQDVSNPPEKDMLWCNFIYHLRRIVIRGDGISVEV